MRLDHLLSKEPSPHLEAYSRVDHSPASPLFCFEGASALLRALQGNAGLRAGILASTTCCRQRLLENCIASTSIFVLPSYKRPTVDALAPSTDEGRGWPRKATGSCRPSVDPWMSEWGNPAPVMGCHSRLNPIGRVEGTRGIETSQYPEEKKATATPLVAASEKGSA